MSRERYIAVDNVCAWPNLTLLPNDEIAACIFNQPSHGVNEGDVVCYVSSDQGRMWECRGIPAPHEPLTNRMNVAAGLNRANDLLVLASGWTINPNVADPHTRWNTEVLPMWVCRSSDNGKTW